MRSYYRLGSSYIRLPSKSKSMYNCKVPGGAATIATSTTPHCLCSRGHLLYSAEHIQQEFKFRYQISSPHNGNRQRRGRSQRTQLTKGTGKLEMVYGLIQGTILLPSYLTLNRSFSLAKPQFIIYKTDTTIVVIDINYFIK